MDDIKPKKYRDVLPDGYGLHWYQLQSVLGRGAYGVTYLALDQNLDRLVAIKEYLPTQFASRDDDDTVHPMTGEHNDMYQWGLDRFLKEARTLAKFNHPNIVRVLSVFEHNNTAYMIMEYEQGEDLARVFKSHSSMTEAELLDIFLPIITGLSLIHKEGFIHRDIKPSNVFIRSDGSPVLIDFGSARQTASGPTQALTSLVTLGYAPFEQYNEGEDKQGPWTDIYALAASIYLAITQRLPTEALARGSALLSNKADPFEPVSLMNFNGFSPNFLLAVDNALMFRAQDRPQDIMSWAKMLKGEVIVKALPSSMLNKSTAIDGTESTIIMSPHDISRPSQQGLGNNGVSALNADLDSTRVSPITSPGNSGVNSNATTATSNRFRRETSQLSSNRTSKAAIQAKSNHTVTLVSALLVTVMAIAIGVFISTEGDNNNTDSASQDKLAVKSDTDSSSTVEPTPDVALNEAERDAKILTLLKQAEDDVAANHLVLPENQSAVYRYMQVLDLDPNNKKARDGMGKITQHYATEVKQYVANDDFVAAEAHISLIEAISPEAEILADLYRILNTSKNKEERVSSLLEKAKENYTLRRITQPFGENAWQNYQDVLRLDPNNKEANAGSQKIVAYYEAKVQRFVKKGQLNTAFENLETLEMLTPASPAVLSLRKKINSSKRREQKRAEISQWLKKASAKFKSGALLKPKNQSALAYYQRILKISPDNESARKGVVRIENHYKKQFDSLLALSKISDARQIADALQQFAPASAVATYTQKQLRLQSLKTKEKSNRNAKPDIELINEALGKFKRALESNNIKALSQISRYSKGREQFVKQIFSQYHSLSIEVSQFKYIGRDHKGLANISITQLINKTGSQVKPGSWGEFDIAIIEHAAGRWRVEW